MSNYGECNYGEVVYKDAPTSIAKHYGEYNYGEVVYKDAPTNIDEASSIKVVVAAPPLTAQTFISGSSLKVGA